jgi:hypothetical protein
VCYTIDTPEKFIQVAHRLRGQAAELFLRGHFSPESWFIKQYPKLFNNSSGEHHAVGNV